MELKDSLRTSQNPATGPSIESAEFCSHLTPYFLNTILLRIIPPSMPRSR